MSDNSGHDRQGGEGDETSDRTEVDSDRVRGERGKSVSGIVALLGLWLILGAVLLGLEQVRLWNDVLVGVLLLAVGAYNYSRRTDERRGNLAAATLVSFLGLWLVVAPFLFGSDIQLVGTATDLGFWNDVVVGLVAMALGAVSAYEVYDQREAAHETRA